jgi:predicted aspartyl protease
MLSFDLVRVVAVRHVRDHVLWLRFSDGRDSRSISAASTATPLRVARPSSRRAARQLGTAASQRAAEADRSAGTGIECRPRGKVMPRCIDCDRNETVPETTPQGGIMTDMGTFRIDVEVENPARPGDRREVHSALVDTGAELSWMPGSVLESLGIRRSKQWRFQQANGTILERWTGSALVYAAGTFATDDVVFGEPGDLVLVGARTLEGLNVRVEPITKRLVDAGPAPAAALVGSG